MKLKEKISWLMGRVQRSLFPHLNECLDTRLTELEQRLVTILEVVQVEKYVPKRAATQWRGRKPLDRQAIARAFVAKAMCRIPATSDLRRALLATINLRRICGFIALEDIPSESTFSRAFTEFAASELRKRAQDALGKDYLSGWFLSANNGCRVAADMAKKFNLQGSLFPGHSAPVCGVH
ncbi:MAG: transposase, partial [Proteobacteria bacterium]|nr:transposase [Pseudomonadota bacterium]